MVYGVELNLALLTKPDAGGGERLTMKRWSWLLLLSESTASPLLLT